MSLVAISFLLFWLAGKRIAFLWLVLPVGFFFDFWRQQPLGLSGLKILLLGGIIWLFFGQFFRPGPKLKI
jgi:hypothetical protein